MKKTVDDAINDFKGIWPDWANLSGQPICWCEETKQWFQIMSPRLYVSGEKPKSAVCNRRKFNRRIKQLSLGVY